MNTYLYALFHIVNQSTDFLLILFRCGMQAIFCLGLASPCQVLMLKNTLLNIEVVRIFSSSCDVYLAKMELLEQKLIAGLQIQWSMYWCSPKYHLLYMNYKHQMSSRFQAFDFMLLWCFTCSFHLILWWGQGFLSYEIKE